MPLDTDHATQDGSTYCPACGSDTAKDGQGLFRDRLTRATSDGRNITVRTRWRQMRCPDCGNVWRDRTKIEEYEQTDT